MKPQYIKNFEKLGLGLFVHFGIYSVAKKGEWYLHTIQDKSEEYESLASKFKVNKYWAMNLVKFAKRNGFKYINITTRHHDGFSLYDTCGLSDYDAPHSVCHRDLIKEFVDECNKEGIVPFFYHTLLDWHHPDYQNNFPKYIDYLIKSIEILCKNYGKIGGFWFDGYWDKPNENWQFDRLYSMIRKYQPDAVIINNTGLSALGEVSHYEIDAVTFERGKPFAVNNGDSKERAGEVCDSLSDHWGYAVNDINIKSIHYLIDLFIECRKNSCNLLLNVGLHSTGSLKPIEKEVINLFGKWISKNKYVLFKTKPSNLIVDNATVFEDENYYYAIVSGVPMSLDDNVTIRNQDKIIKIQTNKEVIDCIYLDNKEKVTLSRDNAFIMKPFSYGVSLYTRTVRFETEKRML